MVPPKGMEAGCTENEDMLGSENTVTEWEPLVMLRRLLSVTVTEMAEYVPAVVGWQV